MPFVSQAQERYAFATHQPWAAEFAAATPKGATLPERLHPPERVSVTAHTRTNARRIVRAHTRRKGSAMKSMRLGGGGRFAAIKAKAAASGARDPGAVAYAAGVKAHGKAKMAKLAAAGRDRALARMHDHVRAH